MGKRKKFAIGYRPAAKAEMDSLRAFDARKIEIAIDENLTYEPFGTTRNRKPLPEIRASFDYVPPLWELRVGEFRIFYDTGGQRGVVLIRAIRHKPSGKITKEIT